jgi:hypothetical protein
MRLLRRLGVLLFLLLPVSSSLLARTLYVSPSGNDTRAGSIADPWRTLLWAANHAQPGDTVYVRGGTYHEDFNPAVSGTANAWIVYSAYPGEEVIVDGDLDGKHEIMEVWQKYLVIQGFTFWDQDWMRVPGKAGYWVSLDGQHIIFRRNRLIAPGNAYQNVYTYQEFSRGIAIGGSNITVEHCFIRGLEFGIVLAGPSPRYTIIRNDTIYATNVSNIAITATGGKTTAFHGTLIEHCVLDTSFTEDNIQFEDEYSKPLDTQYNRGTIIRYNRCGNAAENAIDLKGTERIVLDHNVLYSSLGDDNGPLDGRDKVSGSGLTTKSPGSATRLTLVRYNVIYDNLSGTTMTEGDIYYNNTILNNRRTWEGPNQSDNALFGVIAWSEFGANRILINNIIGGQPNRAMLEWTMDGSGSGFYMNNNLYYDGASPAKFLHRIAGSLTTTTGVPSWKSILSSYSGYTYMGGKDANSLEADPQFVNATMFPVGFDPSRDFNLRAGSPAVDAGRPVVSAQNAGANSSALVVDNAGAFCDGFGITQGDLIKIGTEEPVRILGIDYGTNTIALEEARSWSQGVGVHVAYEGNAPDIGAMESSSTNPNVQVPGPPWLQSPTLGATGLPGDVTLTWDAVPNTDTYEVQVSTAANFQPTIVFQTGIPNPSYEVTGLSGGTTYYWRVRARNTVGASTWSLAFSFLTQSVVGVPRTPGLLSPPSGASGVYPSLTVSWESVDEATSYEIQVATGADFASPVVAAAGISAARYTLPGLNRGTTYYWRVRGTNAGGNGSWSVAYSFTTQSVVTIPTIPSLLSPPAGATGMPLTVTLTWDNNSDASSFQLQVAQTPDFATPLVSRTSITDIKFVLQGLAYSTTYYWRLRASNSAGVSGWSQNYQFTTVAEGLTPTLQPPTLTTPGAAVAGVSTNPVLTWNAISGAESYILQLSEDHTFSSPTVNEAGLTATWYGLDGLKNGITYFWRVAGYRPGANSSWSDVQSFSTFALPPALSGNAVSNASFNNGLASWSFEGSGAFTVAAPGYKDAQSAKIFVAQPSEAVRLIQDGLVMVPDSTYQLSFAGNCSNGHKLSVSLLRRDDASIDYGLRGAQANLENEWKVFSFEITPRNFTSPVNNVRLQFDFGGFAAAGDLYSIDQIQIRTIDPNNPPIDNEPTEPTGFALEQNYPNPFNPVTTIRYGVPTDGRVTLKLYDVLGREVMTLVDDVRSAGWHDVPVTLANQASGVYYYMMVAGNFRATKKLMFVK